jgi:hypothetical protein
VGSGQGSIQELELVATSRKIEMTNTMSLRSRRRMCDAAFLAWSVVLFAGIPLNAQAQVQSSIAIWGDARIPLCEVPDAPGERTVYVVHTINPGTTAARFKIETGPGNTMTYLSETHYFASTAGTTQDGISICYENCLLDNVVLASITYMAHGTSSSCSRLLVVPHPAAQTVEVMDCAGSSASAYGSDLTLHLPGGGCGCPVTHSFPGNAQTFSCSPVAVQTTTWGSIKALYRN